MPYFAPLGLERTRRWETQGFAPAPVATTPLVAKQPAAPEPAVTEADTGRTDRIAKTGARKVAVPAPEIVVPATPAPAAAKDVGRTTQFGFDGGSPAAPRKSAERAAEDKSDKSDKTQPTRAAAPRSKQRQAPIWTYVGVGFTFGLVLLGIYQLVGRLAH